MRQTLQESTAIATIARQLDDAAVYRAYAAQLQHGRRGALARTARALGCSDQHISNVVRRHEAAHPVTFPSHPLIAPCEPAQQATESLEYTPPPFAYPKPEPIAQPEPRKIAQNGASVESVVIPHNPPNVHSPSTVMSHTTPLATAAWQHAELRMLPAWSPVANTQAAADVSYVTAVVMTPLLILAMIAAPVLMVALMPCMLGMWSYAAREQRRVYDSGQE